MSVYHYPMYPFPWPSTLSESRTPSTLYTSTALCSAPFVNWPAQAYDERALENTDFIASGDASTEVVIPDSLVDSFVDGVKVVNFNSGFYGNRKPTTAVDENGNDVRGNRTEGWSLVLTRREWVDKAKWRGELNMIPVYNNATFSTDNKTFGLEYLGSPSTQPSRNQPAIDCSTEYHLLHFRYSPGAHKVLANHYLSLHENSDWLFQLYAGAIPDAYKMPLREPLFETNHFSVCDRYGRNVGYENGRLRCAYKERPPPGELAPATPQVEVPQTEAGEAVAAVDVPKGSDKGLLIGLPVGFIGGLILIVLLVVYGPRLKRKLVGERRIRL